MYKKLVQKNNNFVCYKLKINCNRFLITFSVPTTTL